MEFTVAYKFEEAYIPPRCRKPRTREVTETMTLDIPAVKSTEAPIAFTHNDCWFPKKKVYRWFEGNLYARQLRNIAGERVWMPLKDLRRDLSRTDIPRYRVKSSREKAIEAAKDLASNYLILNGNEVWAKTGEPRYVIATFGLGCNHGGTALMIHNSYNGNIAGSRYFTALQRDEAVKEAVRIALARDDTEYVKFIKRSYKIIVKIPEAVRCNPPAETGPGDSFINTLDALSTLKCPAAAGLLAIGLALKGDFK